MQLLITLTGDARATRSRVILHTTPLHRTHAPHRRDTPMKWQMPVHYCSSDVRARLGHHCLSLGITIGGWCAGAILNVRPTTTAPTRPEGAEPMGMPINTSQGEVDR